GGLDLLGLHLAAKNLTVADVAGSGTAPQGIELFGGISVATSFVHFDTALGTEQNPGIAVGGGQLRSLNVTVDGGFSLFGTDVSADGLTIRYSSAAHQLQL